MKKRILALALLAATLFSFTACSSDADTSKGSSASSSAGNVSKSTSSKASKKANFVIGFSNSYNGNSYRQGMEKYAKQAAEALKKTGEVSDLVFAESNQNNSTQVQQIQNFIMQGVDAIVIDPGSSTALNGAIQEASDAGIPCIIVNDGPVSSTAKLCYQINFDTVAQMGALTDYVCKAIGQKGNIIELRGTAGSQFDAIAHKGVQETLKKYPNVKVVSEIYTDWTGSKAQSELASVLPTLGKVDGVVTQGGDSYAAVQAFQSAKRPLPIIGGDNRGYFLKWWATQAPKDYNTISISSNPWDGASAVYVATDILDGKMVPKNMTHPYGVVTKSDVQSFKNVADEAIACPTFSRAWVETNLYK